MFTNNFDPVAFSIFSLEFRWYSLAYIAGILIGWVYCKKKLIKDQKILDLFDDFITYAILGIIVGGRIGYVLFYNFEYFFNNPIEILFVWNGGMSFHGGLIGVIIASNLFSKLNKVNTFIFLDLVSLSAPIGIFFGRIANFINSELYGTPTEVPWSVKFIAVDDINRHPSQLYEAFLEGIVLFFMLQFILKKNFAKKTGQISCLFLVLYSFFRIITEFFRTPDLHIGYLFFNLTLGQLISAVFLSIGLALYFYLKNEN
ncbi:prolipoprotein diacylglyceryl transferase [Candidatus Pelagibacter sp.]|jgi:phosphatidylglycerol:prolipoprotein diacylglycerol transferase|nr:prolipoprotein diacylglyceryl transferase [Candidatus Pelagibacter sp.]MBT3693666.1 prolipoprotein diacylglyceryl transferase [Candidatus Pelagibacter sp.]MDB9808159.1 prolipoprotein diacylglyceryl transferase [Candidatus Pelagibacter sp.]MDC1082278.1 prolipoprotein diacylglyceryl transferase [Candidatus Pelagibacter sp.]|tara:strand:- start:34 stop:807 length:774 start_codon:yes stop_codon:yes gene_type:complete